MGQRLKSMKIWSVMVVSSGGEASEGGGVVVVRESEVVERTREWRVIMGLRWRGGGGGWWWWWERRSWGWGVKEQAMMVE